MGITGGFNSSYGLTSDSRFKKHSNYIIQLEVSKHSEGKRGFILSPRRWLVERSFAWAVRFRRLAPDYERLAITFGAFHVLVFGCLIIASLLRLFA